MNRSHAGMVDGVVILLVLLAVWQGLFAYAGAVALTPPLATFAYAAELLGQKGFWNHAEATMAAFGWSLLISAAAGIAVGLWLGARRFAGDVAEPMLAALYTIPKVTL